MHRAPRGQLRRWMGSLSAPSGWECKWSDPRVNWFNSCISWMIIELVHCLVRVLDILLKNTTSVISFGHKSTLVPVLPILIRLPPSTISMLSFAYHQVIYIGHWTLVIRYWILDTGYFTLDIGHLTLDIWYSILDIGYWILDIGYWTLDMPYSRVYDLCELALSRHPLHPTHSSPFCRAHSSKSHLTALRLPSSFAFLLTLHGCVANLPTPPAWLSMLLPTRMCFHLRSSRSINSSHASPISQLILLMAIWGSWLRLLTLTCSHSPISVFVCTSLQ